MQDYNRDDRSRADHGRRDFGKRGFGGRNGPREMYKAVCDKCGKDCEVPFKPTGGRPVYCSDCFERKDEGFSAPRDFQDRGPRRSDFERRESPRAQNNDQLSAISSKLDKILEILMANTVKEKAVKEDAPAAKEDIKTPKKKPSVKKK